MDWLPWAICGVLIAGHIGLAWFRLTIRHYDRVQRPRFYDQLYSARSKDEVPDVPKLDWFWFLRPTPDR